VSDFQNLLKECCSLHQKFSHKKGCFYQPSLKNNAESPNNNHLDSRNSLWTRFILTASATNSVSHVGKARYTTVQMEKLPHHGRAISPAAKYTLISVFTIESAQHVMLFLWIGTQNDRVFLFASGYRSADSDTVRIKCWVSHISSTVMVAR